MNNVDMTLEGSRQAGWQWEVTIDGAAIYRTVPVTLEFTDVLRTSAKEQVWAKHRVVPARPTEVGMFLFLVEGAADDADRR